MSLITPDALYLFGCILGACLELVREVALTELALWHGHSRLEGGNRGCALEENSACSEHSLDVELGIDIALWKGSVD